MQHVKMRQRSSLAKRKHLCESLANEPAAQGPLTAKTYYLPSSVQGSPRHLRRLRVDALETARRKGPPTWFITLTTNPRWKEILDQLLAGQNATDRPDITVRVFHAKLAIVIKFLKEKFCGTTLYIMRVIEYQKRGLPHAHIVIGSSSPPRTASELDFFITCELPAEGPVRDLALAHMVHRCNHGCHPLDPSDPCSKGCPWPLREETEIDGRGYPLHRRRPCGGHCPNCSSGRTAYGNHQLRNASKPG